jgi:hypothetical protein
MIDIESILKLGETQSVEFKKSMSKMKEGCKSLCGMLNTAEGSGMVIYGISPNNKIVGLQGNLDSAQRTLTQHIRDKFDPIITTSLELERHEDKSILILSAKRPKEIRYYEYDGRAFIKEGSTRRILTLKEKESLRRKPHIDSFSNLISKIALLIFDVIIFGEQYKQRIVKPWLDILRTRYQQIANNLRDFAFQDILIQKGLDKKLIELSDSLDEIVNMRLHFGCGEELNKLFETTLSKAKSFKKDEIDSIPISGDFYNIIKNNITMSSKKLQNLNDRSEAMVGNGRFEEVQSEASKIGYSLLKLSLYNIKQIPTDLKLELHDVAKELHLLETIIFFSDGGRSIRTIEDRINNLSERLNKLTEKII